MGGRRHRAWAGSGRVIVSLLVVAVTVEVLAAAAPPAGTAPASLMAPADELAPLAPPAATPAEWLGGWVATWAAAPVAPTGREPFGGGFRDQTLRQVVRTSIGGTEVRVRLSNAFGTRPVLVSGASLGLRSRGAALVAGSARGLTLDGQRAFSLAPGATVDTDPVDVPVGAGTDLAVSAWLAAPTGPPTWHPEALTTGYVAAGDHVDDQGAGAFAATPASWWYIAGVDVLAPVGTQAVVAFGASTTDGQGSGTNAHARWVDDLNRRLDAAADPGGAVAVVDEGVAGNRLLSTAPGDGRSGDARFEADALSQPGVRTVFVSSLGNDDIGHGHRLSAADLIVGYERLIREAHAAGVRVVGATLTPDRGAAMWTPAGEQVREQINHWILTSHAFDATVDLAAAVAAPGHPDRLKSAFDSGDHLHPDAAGYAAIAAAIDPAVLMGPAPR
jgi:lysophospholipase L1-like esterase